MPKKFRSIVDVYNDSEEIEMKDELFLIGVDEPNFLKSCSKEARLKGSNA